MTDIVKRVVHGQLVPAAPELLPSVTGIREWSKPQGYLGQIIGDSWESLMFCDGRAHQLTPSERSQLRVFKYGSVRRGESRHSTHQREFGGDYKLLDSFVTPFADEAEARFRNAGCGRRVCSWRDVTEAANARTGSS